ncbi:MAG: Hsp20/alpha crystallin family protein [Candidatus Caldatribacterium sp.]|nr:Hsp20/alpha crystallin family protein [Candidatus Caldatribacterium sp.]
MLTPRFDLWRDIADLQERVARLIEEVFPSRERQREVWIPPVDVVEGEKEIVLLFDLPGVDQKDIDISVSGDQITVKGERKPLDSEARFLRQERVFGPFSRTFALRVPVDIDRVTATYRNGVLEIRLPRIEEGKARKVVIQEG